MFDWIFADCCCAKWVCLEMRAPDLEIKWGGIRFTESSPAFHTLFFFCLNKMRRVAFLDDLNVGSNSG